MEGYEIACWRVYRLKNKDLCVVVWDKNDYKSQVDKQLSAKTWIRFQISWQNTTESFGREYHILEKIKYNGIVTEKDP